MAVCSCDVTLSNTGVGSCQPLQAVAKKIIIVPLVNGSNVRNGIDLSSIPTNTQIIDLINAADPAERYYPLPTMENVTNERADSITEEAPSGTIAKIRNGAKTFTGEIWFQGSTYAGAIDAFGCGQVGAYIVDGNDNLIGDKKTTGYLYPLAIKMPTWDVKTIDTTDSTVAKISLTFQWKDSIADSDVGMLLASDFDSSTSWLDYNGLINLNGVASAISTTAFSMKVTTPYGSVVNPVVAGGLVIGDFEIYNVTTASPVVISTFNETPTGTYAFTFLLQTSADVLSLRISPSTKGYDDTLLSAVVITIP